MNETYELVKSNIYACKDISIEVDDTYHHNISLKDVPSALKYGLLSVRGKANLEGRKLTEEEIFRNIDTYHVNGLDNISLSSMKLDFSKIYRDEIYYDYKDSSCDIVISDKVRAIRNTTNYYNEYLVADKIPVEFFNSVDVRILISIEKQLEIEKLIQQYEYLRKIAIAIKENNLNVPLREASNDEIITLNPEKIINMPIIKKVK